MLLPWHAPATELSWISLKMTGRVTTFASILEMMATAARKAARGGHIVTVTAATSCSTDFRTGAGRRALISCTMPFAHTADPIVAALGKEQVRISSLPSSSRFLAITVIFGAKRRVNQQASVCRYEDCAPLGLADLVAHSPCFLPARRNADG